MFTKGFEKYVNSLKQKKYRYQHQRFIAEGTKTVLEFLTEHFVIEKLIATKSWLNEFGGHFNLSQNLILTAEDYEIKKISALSNPSEVMLIAVMPRHALEENVLSTDFSLVLDDMQDPGNLGSIIRIADWFGIPYIFISENSTDPYNPKTVQASMGSLSRIHVIEMNLETLFTGYASVPVYCASTSGENFSEVELKDPGFLLFGNEGHGISLSLEKYFTKKIAIPKYGKAESLNVAVAAGIICNRAKQRPS
jgi:RNA methyltransferase, TrmH family